MSIRYENLIKILPSKIHRDPLHRTIQPFSLFILNPIFSTHEKPTNEQTNKRTTNTCRHGLRLAMYIIGGILIAGTLANIHAWTRAFGSLFVSQGRHLKKALKNNEGAPLTALGTEVSLMTDMVKVWHIHFSFFLH